MVDVRFGGGLKKVENSGKILDLFTIHFFDFSSYSTQLYDFNAIILLEQLQSVIISLYFYLSKGPKSLISAYELHKKSIKFRAKLGVIHKGRSNKAVGGCQKRTPADGGRGVEGECGRPQNL